MEVCRNEVKESIVGARVRVWLLESAPHDARPLRRPPTTAARFPAANHPGTALARRGCLFRSRKQLIHTLSASFILGTSAIESRHGLFCCDVVCRLTTRVAIVPQRQPFRLHRHVPVFPAAEHAPTVIRVSS